MSAPAAVVVLCTAPDVEVGTRLSRDIVTAGLAACVNVIPGLRSIYVWEGELTESAEVQLLVKTTPERVDALARFIAEHHPYEVPEVLCLPVIGGAEGYLAWVRDATGG